MRDLDKEIFELGKKIFIEELSFTTRYNICKIIGDKEINILKLSKQIKLSYRGTWLQVKRLIKFNIIEGKRKAIGYPMVLKLKYPNILKDLKIKESKK